MRPIAERVRLGISAINWVNEDMHELGDHYTFEDLMRDFTSLGFEGTEMCRKFPQTAAGVRDALAAHGLKLGSWWRGVRFADPAFREEELAEYRRHAEFLKEAGASHIVTCEVWGAPHADPAFEARVILSDEQWRNLAEGLNAAGAIASELGMKLVYHYHAGTVVEGPGEIERLMAATDPSLVHLLLDTGHAVYGGGDPAVYAEQYKDRIAYVHLKDVRPDVLEQARRENWDFLTRVRKGVFTVPGDGCVDFAAVLGRLDANGYEGWMILEAEQDPAIADPVDYAARGKSHLQALLRQGGVKS
ncbi:myo-inosose-2 dehydratase [Paenibacillus sp. MWE-103]|uniref:Myo-inosose-2 dehydratase n=1 Tax=Paenibacillus artemisiicola TaxID=1172618 RepID=A0ABS3WJ78_9BACL|nr:myo-inosose-2 dehydratase [Paenibacillus artemisiicola]MBO7748379.1 myo-inosose-2 dehydratase [Paenibacillus artemisiicola]